MNKKSDNSELFCRINIHTEMPHGGIVSFIARIAGGESRMNAVKSAMLDISVDDNDVFDADKARAGKNRWLYSRYTLEIDPNDGVPAGEYIAAIGALLKSHWSSGIDAVAACEFEEKLPRNVRRSEVNSLQK